MPREPDPETPLPLVLMFHGGGPGSPDTVLEASGMREKADEEGFLVAALRARGADDNRSVWNAGFEGSENGGADVAFADAAIGSIADKVAVDLDRVYAVGFSLGGAITYRLACQLSHRLAAVGVMSRFSSRTTQNSGDASAYDCERSGLAHPMPILHIHGLADTCVRYQGGVGTGINQSTERTRVPRTIANWSARNGCENTMEPGPSPAGTECRTRGICDASSAIQLCTIEDQGHVWPGDARYLLDGRCGGEQTDSIDATDQFWDVVSVYRLSELSE